ncbi:hypothetical protein [Chelativorans sp. M5D2P16]|uniref:hypothetical protein n=1 Tax=Chelativorans sp. M5D2P16 TaxID=3095678 RepID=UPI002ACADDE2|nr:hypothetical protein [Chelativorans sp. M5D2P16]MDZ5697994.1 hypothetical protein [Chelativorans sp. M5D2P16]
MTRRLTAYAFAWLAATGVAAASDLAPESGHSLHLARFNGTLYYTVEEDGFHVVATLAEGEDGLPVRFMAILADGQVLAISVPGRPGETGEKIEILRAGSKVRIDMQPQPGAFVSARP